MKLVICTKEQHLTKQGIHLNSPDAYYIQDALQAAERDMFETIYCHYQNIGLQYSLSEGALSQLFELALDFGIRVSVEHPASPQSFLDNVEKRRA